MRTIAVANQKGGSCKTTTAVNVAAALAAAGRRVLVVDLDGQGNATQWLKAPEDGGALLSALADGGSLADLALASSVAGVDVVPGGPRLAGADKALAATPGAEMALREMLGAIPPRRWDYVIADCPPALGLLSLSALVGCREVLIPIVPSTMAITGLVRLFQTVGLVRQRYAPGPALAGILVCRADARTRLTTDVVETLRSKFPGDVFEAVVRENVRVAEAPSSHKAIAEYAPSSTGARDYAAVAAELEARKPTKPRKAAA